MILEKLSGPVIGAVIGYFTNYIAVKMLFYPRKEIKVWGHKIPFTPGAIPKGKPRLAKAVGNIVATTLITEEDIKEKILSAETEHVVVDRFMDTLSTDIHSSMLQLFQSEEKYEKMKNGIANNLTEQVLDAVHKVDIGTTVATESRKIIEEKTKGTMLEMLLKDELISSFLQPIGEEIEKYIDKNGKDYIEQEIVSRVNAVEEKSIVLFCEDLNLSEDDLKQMVVSMYRAAAETAVSNIVGQLNIAKMIEDKVNKMCVEDLEEMVLSVMKKELNTIVNLGAIVGGILGIFNMFF